MKSIGRKIWGLAIIAGFALSLNQAFGFGNNTSTSSPYVFWVNDNYDRSLYSADDGTNIDDDALPTSYAACCPYTPGTPTPDYNYRNAFGERVIPCKRDLQDFARLWAAGVTSDLRAKLPTNSTITLNWGDVGSPNPENPTIDLFVAAQPGYGYLTNDTIATKQVDPTQCPYAGRIGPGQSLQLNANQFGTNWLGNDFIWCGVSNGVGALNMTIADGSGNVLATTTAYLQIVNIKQMYERWTVGDRPAFPPTNVPACASEGLPPGTPSFQYPLPQDATTPYILFVHGWNMQTWEKDGFAESAFKRLYWQGYRGRFGSFRWPTGNGFGGTAWDLIANSRNFDSSEYQSWLSAVGLTNLLTKLNAEYPGNVYLIAHSMGNVVSGEALRMANSQLVNTYIAMEGAIASHAYDATTTNRALTYLGVNFDIGEPDSFANYYTDGSPCYFNDPVGAGTYVNFYNTNDYALGKWTIDQDVKPDHGLQSYPGYQYSSSSGFYVIYGPNPGQTVYLNFSTNTYQIFGYCEQARCYALGAQRNVDGVFGEQQVNLPSVWPPDTLPGLNYSSHFWHSGEFRGDYAPQIGFWGAILGPQGLNLQ